MIIKKKGQAAMEFLMTYGWAILAAIIVVGVLWYIIGNPGDLAGDKYALSPPLTAGQKTIALTGVTLEVRNGAGGSITISDIAITNCGNVTGGLLAQGALGTYTVLCALVSGDRFNGDIKINYTVGTSALAQYASGTISGKVP